MVNDLDRARSALYSIPPDLPRDEWVRAGMAAHATGLSFDDFDAWSASAPSYNAQACHSTWKSFNPGKGVGAGTLFAMEREHGGRMGMGKPQQKSAQAPRNAIQINASVSGSGTVCAVSRNLPTELELSAPPCGLPTESQ